MKRSALLLVVVVLVVFGTTAVFAQSSGARFSSLNGQVEVRPDAEARAWKLAQMGMNLNVMDHVRTQEESSAILSFTDMSTFVLKAESEIVLTTPPDKDSKVKLVAGNVWVNVKKMLKDGSMEVEMNQAVAGIKGTNIIVGSDGNEDRISVLRGEVDVLIKATNERLQLKEGEFLSIMAGGKTEKREIDVGAEQKKWEKELSGLGDSIDLGEVPEVIRGLLQSSGEEFSKISDVFKGLLSAQAPTLEQIQEMQKDAERFVGALMEDMVILSAIRSNLEKALTDPKTTQQASGYMKALNDAGNTLQRYQSEIGKMMKTKFNTALGGSEEVQALAAAVGVTWSEVQALISQRSGAGGLSQSWYKTALEALQAATERFSAANQDLAGILEKYPTNTAAQSLQRQISTYLSATARQLKDFQVVEIDPSVTTELQQADDEIGDAIIVLRQEIDSYNTEVKSSNEAQLRLKRSLSILNNFSRARRLYTSSQRLYDSVMRSAGKNLTAEQEELKATFEHIQDTFQQLGSVATDLQNRLQDLEEQLSRQLK
jgi:hypothetical protein